MQKKRIGRITLIKGLRSAKENFKQAQRELEFEDTDPAIEPLRKCGQANGHTDRETGKNGLPPRCKEVGCIGWGSPKSCPLGAFMDIPPELEDKR